MARLEHQICVMTTKNLHKLLMKIAKKHNVSMNELVREAIYEYLKMKRDY